MTPPPAFGSFPIPARRRGNVCWTLAFAVIAADRSTPSSPIPIALLPITSIPSSSKQVLPVCSCDRLSPAMHFELPEDVLDVDRDGLRADRQPRSDFLLIEAVGEQPEDLDLTRGQAPARHSIVPVLSPQASA